MFTYIIISICILFNKHTFTTVLQALPQLYK